MTVKKYLVIYEYDEENCAAMIEGEYPDSSAPHVWNLPDDSEIIAVIDIDSGPRIWMDEQEIELDENKE